MAFPQLDNKETGYIKLYRSILSNGWLRNHKLWVFWSYCLLKACHREQKVMIGNQQITLKPGQFIFGRRKASKETRLSERQIRTCVYNLCTMGNLTIKTTNKYSLVTIINWELYQNTEDKTTSKTTSNRPATDHIQELKNDKKYNKSSPEAFHLSNLLASFIRKNNPSHRDLSNGKYQTTVERWAVDIDRMVRLDARPIKEVEAVIRWAQSHPFWSTNILSGAKLREQYDQLKVKMNRDASVKNKKEERLADQYPTL